MARATPTLKANGAANGTACGPAPGQGAPDRPAEAPAQKLPPAPPGSPGPQTLLFDAGLFAPNLYAFVVAPPGSGKGALAWARKLGRAVHRRLKERSQEDIEAWEYRQEAYQEAKRKKVPVRCPRPPASGPTASGSSFPAMSPARR